MTARRRPSPSAIRIISARRPASRGGPSLSEKSCVARFEGRLSVCAVDERFSYLEI
jgi:hypothetical protein